MAEIDDDDDDDFDNFVDDAIFENDEEVLVVGIGILRFVIIMQFI